MALLTKASSSRTSSELQLQSRTGLQPLGSLASQLTTRQKADVWSNKKKITFIQEFIKHRMQQRWGGKTRRKWNPDEISTYKDKEKKEERKKASSIFVCPPQ